ncbi:MAG TPA: hypothetical protein VHW02_00865 [Rhizomicrobium sp.]|jgi:hypothetical protein|nr:hypothetical protein [Rhizomicrobium sp.]
MTQTIERGEANIITLMALGVLAYVSETLLHEAVGHGTLCLLGGGKITLLAPLYMRCSAVTLAMVVAGPCANLLGGLICLLALQFKRSEPARSFDYFLWLFFIFNWLVAAGYLLVGAATGFGDWSVAFAGVKPDWMWRAPAFTAALLFYLFTLKLASRSFARLTGFSGQNKGGLARLALLPTAAASIIALGAEVYGQGAKPLGLALAFGCTFFIGLTLLSMDGAGVPAIGESKLRIGFNVPVLVLALLAAAGFILIVGPGVALTAI